MTFLELALGISLAPDSNEILYLPVLPDACLGLAGGGVWGVFIHGPW